ncbi:MAG TPA: YCF48-related protein [Ignavibacteriaceae bacterium]|nr:YCF48-related protein [Ignavibacteriaceae bacterium]
MKTLFTLFLIFITSRIIFTQNLLYPTIPSDMITDLHYLNDTEIIFINAGGDIFKSYDSGITWDLKKYYRNNNLAEIQFLDENTGFIRTQNSSLEPNNLKYTNDGGETWNEQSLSIYPANSFLPVSESIMLKATIDGQIQRLDNFYDNWDTTFQVATFTDSDYFQIVPFGSITKLEKLNNGSIIALGTNENAFYHGIMDDSLSYILRSNDQGLTWDTLWIGLEQFIKDILFVDESTGWMISDTSLFKSSDGGLIWNIHTAGFDDSYYKDLFAKANNVYLISYYNRLIKSTDSGNTWTIKELNLYNNLTSIIFNDENNGFLFGDGLLKSTDSGENWENLNKEVNNDIYDIDFISIQEGIAFGNNGVYKTYDGGNSWIPKFNPGGLLYNITGTIKMVSDSVGWLLARYENIYKTNDRGESWNNIIFYEPNQSYDQMEFYDENLGILTTFEESNPGSGIYDISNCFITTNGGEGWVKKPLDSLYFDKLKFTDPTHLFGTNRFGLWLSRDTSRTWENIYSGNGSSAFDFYDSLFGVYSFSYWGSLITTNGGISWGTINKEVGSHVSDCRILGPDYSGSYRVIESGGNGVLMLTYIYPNGEINYSYQMPSYTGKSLNKIDEFVEDDFPNVWITGNGFTILYRQFEKISTDVDITDYQPQTFYLSQNYPNPFNPETKIKFSIPENSHVLIKIYDILGNEIISLVDEEKPAGVYEVLFDGKNLASGFYFYRINTGDFTETKKMILLK